MIIDSIILIILLVCFITDIKSRKIYNVVLLPGLILSLASNVYLDGWQRLGSSLLGLLVGMAILFIPFAMGGMGAGDVKLLGLIGAWKGVFFVLTTALYMALVGGLLAILVILFQKGAKERLRGIMYFFIFLFQGKIRTDFIKTKVSQITYPYGVAIVIGAICTIYIPL
ncbi:prepilin peptidase [Bacillaceae bacterium S4-13-56]